MQAPSTTSPCSTSQYVPAGSAVWNDLPVTADDSSLRTTYPLSPRPKAMVSLPLSHHCTTGSSPTSLWNATMLRIGCQSCSHCQAAESQAASVVFPAASLGGPAS